MNISMNCPTYQLVNNLMKKYKGSIIVDNGCDNNYFKEMFNKNIIGLEVNKEAEADVYSNGITLPFKNKSVDLFISNFVLEHVENEEVYINEMYRCLKKGGKIILSVPRPIWYLSFFISPYNYWIALKNIREFFANPNRYITHGHPQHHTLFYEFSEWEESRYEQLFSKFNILEKITNTNFLSLDSYYAKIFSKIDMPNWLNVHVTYVLEKN